MSIAEIERVMREILVALSDGNYFALLIVA